MEAVILYVWDAVINPPGNIAMQEWCRVSLFIYEEKNSTETSNTWVNLMCFARILLNHSAKSEICLNAKSQMILSSSEQSHTHRSGRNTEK